MAKPSEIIKRRKHKNSKLGCQNCKKRRVKCSEDLPQCLNCVKHKVRCGYLDYSPDQIEEIKRSKAGRESISGESISGKPQDKSQDDGQDDEFEEEEEDDKYRGSIDTTNRGSLSDSMNRGSLSDSINRGSLSDSINRGSVSDRVDSRVDSRGSIIDSRVDRVDSIGSMIDNRVDSIPNMIDNRVDRVDSIGSMEDIDMVDIEKEKTLNKEINNLSIGLGFKPVQYYNNFNNILNHASNTISQNFDNLLATDDAPDKDMSIVYPVYSIVNNQGLSPFDVKSYGGTSYTGTSHGGASNPSSHAPTPFATIDGFVDEMPVDNIQQNLLQSLMSSSTVPQEYLINIASPPQIASSRQLPSAIASDFTFKRLVKVEHDYRKLLIDTVIRLGPKISSGTATLIEIRGLYNIWLNSFLYKSYDSELMFSCLINLTTNFLISNTFNNFNLINTKQFINITNIKNILILLSIRYYAIVIKGIRDYLNNNFDPELCSSVSYILSLMSIYDPEVSLNSINCFTDGMFSVLKFNLNLALKKGLTPPILIPVHLRLMENIQKSVYFPGYDPRFLTEYRTMLDSFGKILAGINLANPPLTAYVNKHYRNLWEYADQTINEYLPIIISNLHDNQIQQEVLFKMTSSWVRLFPSKLLIINDNSHIIEKILYLFFKAFKKSLFAIVPQVKFYFLRDFDSPLMLDVFSFINDTEIFFDKDLEAKFLAGHKTELKCLISYCVRLLNYFQRRLQFMYKTVVYESSTKKLFPIQERKSMVIDIPRLRANYYECLNVKETNLVSFCNGFIRPYNFPHTEDMEVELGVDEVRVDHLSLTHGGFLAGDVVTN